MIDIIQLRRLVIRPVAEFLEMDSVAAQNLLIGTALVESGLRHLEQLGGGPALGVYQMEPATHDDIWRTWLAHRPKIRAEVRTWRIGGRGASEMAGNLYYATAMARVHYWRDPQPLPDATDIRGLGEYWKRVWNTEQGAGTVERFVDVYRKEMT
jgi:hypothetical protein